MKCLWTPFVGTTPLDTHFLVLWLSATPQWFLEFFSDFRLLPGECAVYVFPKALDRVAAKLFWRISRRRGLPVSAFASFELSKVPRKGFSEQFLELEM